MRGTGSLTTAVGSNAAATMAIESHRTNIAAISGGSTGFGSPACRLWFMAATRDSNTGVIGLRFSTRGRNIGRMTGMTTTTFMWNTKMAAITCSTTGIPVSE